MQATLDFSSVWSYFPFPSVLCVLKAFQRTVYRHAQLECTTNCREKDFPVNCKFSVTLHRICYRYASRYAKNTALNHGVDLSIESLTEIVRT